MPAPMTADDYASFIRSQGLNPDDYDIQGAVAAGESQVSGNSNLLTQPPGALETAGRAASRSALPIAGGAAGWGLGAALAPESGGLSLAIPLVSSILAGYGASKGQEALLSKLESPEKYQLGLQQLQAGEEAHPIAGFLGGTAPMLAFGSPGLGGGLANALKGAAINTIGSVANQALEGQDVTSGGNLKEDALAALTGAAFNNPARLGKLRAFGGPGLTPPEAQTVVPLPEVKLDEFGRPIPQIEGVQTPTLAPQTTLTAPKIVQPTTITRQDQTGLAQKPEDFERKKAEEELGSDYADKIQEAYERKLLEEQAKADADKRIALQDEIAKGAETKIGLPPASKIAPQQQEQPTSIKPNSAPGAQQVIDSLTKNELFVPQEQKDQLAAQIQAAMTGNQVKPVETPTKVNPQKTNTKGIEADNAEIATPANTQAEQIGDDIDAKLAKLKIDTKGKLYDAVQGIPVTVWNGAIDAVRIGIKAGKAIHQAIQDGIQWIKSNHPNLTFDEGKLTESLKQELGVKEAIDKDNPLHYSKLGEISSEVGKPIEGIERETLPSPAEPPSRTIPGIRSLNEDIAAKGDTDLKQPADKVLEDFNLLKGKFGHEVPTILSLNTHDAEAVAKLAQEQYQRGEDLSRFAENEQQRQALKELANVNKVTLDEQNNRGLHIDSPAGPRAKEAIPHYIMQQVSAKAHSYLVDKPNGPEAQNLRRDYLQQQVNAGKSIKEAQKMLNERLASMTPSKASITDQTKYGPTRLPQGEKLPNSWLEKDIRKTIGAFIARTAKDLAWRTHIENNPRIARRFGYDKATVLNKQTGKFEEQDLTKTQPNVQPTTSRAVKDFADYIRGEHTSREQIANGAARFATSLFIGSPALGVHVGISTINKTMEFAHWHEIPAIVAAAATDIKRGVERALYNGIARRDPAAVGYEMTNLHNVWAENLANAANFVTKVTGRQAMDLYTKGMAQNALEALIKMRTIEARQGNKQAIEMLQRIDPAYNFNHPDVLAKAADKGSEVSRMASRVLQTIHGQYDARTMPAWMLKDGFIAPFFKLASWGIGQTNSFMKNVYTPAESYVKSGGKMGTIEPFLISTAGAIIGGGLIKALREDITGREGPIPTLNEVFNSSKGYEGNIPIAAYQAMAMASYAGYAGLFSQVGKSLMDLVYKNEPQGAAFPLDEVVSSGVKTLSNYYQAMMNGDGDFTKMTMQTFLDLGKENVAMARMANNWLAKNGASIPSENYKIQTAIKERNLRAFKEVEGLPYKAQESDESNPYMEINQKLFKQERDPQAAAKELPNLIHSLIQRFGSNPEVLRSKLEGLKSNNYQTMPSPENEPLTSPRYLNFVRKTQGVGAEQALVNDYYRQSLLNKLKSSWVP